MKTSLTREIKLEISRGPAREELVLFESRVLRAGQAPACTQCAAGVLGAVVGMEIEPVQTLT